MQGWEPSRERISEFDGDRLQTVPAGPPTQAGRLPQNARSLLQVRAGRLDYAPRMNTRGSAVFLITIVKFLRNG